MSANDLTPELINHKIIEALFKRAEQYPTSHNLYDKELAGATGLDISKIRKHCEILTDSSHEINTGKHEGVGYYYGLNKAGRVAYQTNKYLLVHEEKKETKSIKRRTYAKDLVSIWVPVVALVVSIGSFWTTCNNSQRQQRFEKEQIKQDSQLHKLETDYRDLQRAKLSNDSTKH
jgi:hypothetical protein